MENNPIAAWIGGRGTDGTQYFKYEHGVFGATFTVPAKAGALFGELVREIVDWRLAEYLRRVPLNATDGSTASKTTGATVGKSYTRDEIPALYDLTADGRTWQQGYVRRDNHIFLFVTLDKSEMPEEHKYHDRFLSPGLFEWKSQNQQARKHPKMQEMRAHRELGISVHLFVRKKGKIDGKAAPFVYCGDVEFVEWEEDNPITVRWRLGAPLTTALVGLFGVGGEKQ